MARPGGYGYRRGGGVGQFRDGAPTPTREFEAMGFGPSHTSAGPGAAPFQDAYGAVYDEAETARSHSPPRQVGRFDHDRDPYDDRDRWNPPRSSGLPAYDRFDDRPIDRSNYGRSSYDRPSYTSSYNDRSYNTRADATYRDDRSYRGSSTGLPPSSPTYSGNAHGGSRGYHHRASSVEYDSRSSGQGRFGAPSRGRGWRASSYEPRESRDPFVLKPPAPAYVALSCESHDPSPTPVPKLLVLDLNGALVYRTSRGTVPRTAYPRPFLANFLEYLFGADADGRGYEVMVWSSAQPHNVRNMVETTFEPEIHRGVWDTEGAKEKAAREARGESRLLDVWARDKMGLSSQDYGNKVQTVKDLRKVTDVYTKYSEKTTVLLDDSALKAMHQPWSQVIIPEYDRPEFTDARDAAGRLWAAAEPVDGADEPGMDNILLGVIGILEAMRDVPNVPAWVRAGHIHTPTDVSDAPPAPTVTLADLPSHASFVPWFEDKAAHAYWAEKGRAALARRGIEVSHGLMPDGFGVTPERIAARERALRTLDHEYRLARWRERVKAAAAACDSTNESPTEGEGADAAAGQPRKGKSKSQIKRDRRRSIRRKERKALAALEAGDADAGSGAADTDEECAREGSVADEPRDDVRPGARPAPFTVYGGGRPYSTQAGNSPAAPRGPSPTFSPPDREVRAYSPSHPV